jgi:hypothetical protein
MAFKEVKSSDFLPTWDFEQEARIEGKYVGKREGIGKWKKNVYQVKTADGVYEVWGSTVLDRKMGEVEEGSQVQIEHLGEMKGKNGSYHDWSVMFDDGK